jgi:predicted AlkP superfamily pyrophosphatase or phosphodiesterase
MKKKVLIIGLDGCRADAYQKAKTPNLDALANNGAYSWNAQTELHTISGPAWTSLLTGVHDDKHNVFDNDFKPRNFIYKTIFALIKETNPQIRCVGHSHWKPIITEIFEKKILDHSSSGSDRKMAYRIAQDIKKDEEWLICVVSDHGGDGTSHGMPTTGCLTIIFIVSGAMVVQKGEIPGIEDEAPSIVDMVPTIAKFFGLPPKSEWDGIARGL